MTRLEKTIDKITQLYMQIEEDSLRYTCITHHSDVYKAMKIILMIDNLENEYALVAAYLHDVGAYVLHQEPHAFYSARFALDFLGDCDYTEDEINRICEMMLHHSEKNQVHNSEIELLKNADCLAHYYEFDDQRYLSRIQKYIIE